MIFRLAATAFLAFAAWAAWQANAAAGTTTTTSDTGDVPDMNATGGRSYLSAQQILDLQPEADPGGVLTGAELLAFCSVESGFNVLAYRFEPRLQQASYGLMQVLASTAEQVAGITDPAAMYDPATGIRVGILALSSLRADAARRLGRELTEAEAVGCYNAGGRGVAEGHIPAAYVAHWRAARDRFAAYA